MPDEEPLTAAIELVSHDVRADILVAFAEHQREHPTDQWLRFSELRRRVGHDDPGNFNYHLQRLVGSLVERSEDGYRLSDVGHRFLAVLHSGRFDPALSREFPDLEIACLFCDGAMTVTYADGLLRTRCPAGHETRLDVGPELFEEHSIEAVVNLALCRSLEEGRAFLEGICPLCDGPTTGGLERVSDGPVPVQYVGQCRRCGLLLNNTIGGTVLFHPAVVAFAYRRDLDVFREAWTAMTTLVRDTVILAEDPLRVRIELERRDDILELVLDETGSVIRVGDGEGGPGR